MAIKIWTSEIFGLFTSCATTPPPVEEQPIPVRVGFEVKSTSVIENPSPLQNQSEIEVTWNMSDGSVETQKSFRGWDFDHDGRFDMLEILTSDGKTKSWAMDFNSDGKIDILKAAMKAEYSDNQKQGVEVSEISDQDAADKLLQLSH